jgi:hypothetical protein
LFDGFIKEYIHTYVCVCVYACMCICHGYVWRENFLHKRNHDDDSCLTYFNTSIACWNLDYNIFTCSLAQQSFCFLLFKNPEIITVPGPLLMICIVFGALARCFPVDNFYSFSWYPFHKNPLWSLGSVWSSCCSSLKGLVTSPSIAQYCCNWLGLNVVICFLYVSYSRVKLHKVRDFIHFILFHSVYFIL